MWLTVRTAVKLRRVAGVSSHGGHMHPEKDAGQATPTYLWMITGALNARDRYRASIRSQRAASRGSIVISDRYPLPGLLGMDGPRDSEETLSQLVGGRRWLAWMERRYYERVPRPNVVIALRVDSEIAIRRRPNDNPATITARTGQIAEAEWPNWVLVVDANKPHAEVLKEIQRKLWSRLPA